MSVDKIMNVDVIIKQMREQCSQRGLKGVLGLATFFRGIDSNRDKSLTIDEFSQGLRERNIKLSNAEMKILFDSFDKDKSGSIDFREFLLVLQAPLNNNRLKVVNEAFDKLDVNQDGLIRVDDLQVVLAENARQHPKFIAGEWSLDDVYKQFIQTFDDPKNPDGAVSRKEFLQYYSNVSATIDDDAYFDLMMRSAWGLPHRKKYNSP